MWPLTIYNIPMTKIEEMQRQITVLIKKWMGIPKNLSNSCLFSKTSKLKLPFTSLTEEFRTIKARNLVTFQHSSDPCIREAEINVDKGRKVNTAIEIEDAKSRLRMQEITGVPNIGREGLGIRTSKLYSKCSSKDKRDLIIKTLREKEEEKRVVHMATLSKQGAHLKWEVPQRRISKTDLTTTSDEKIKFLIKSVYDLLPTPANKNKWFNTDERCLLCGENATLNHILAGCKVALSQGRYKWRHDKVLNELACILRTKIAEGESNLAANRKVVFVKEGVKGQAPTAGSPSRVYMGCTPQPFLASAQDWELTVDLKERLRIPQEVAITELRPDIIITSKDTNQMAIIELTVPTEDRIEISGELKRTKYEVLVTEGRRNGWQVRC